MRVMSLWAEMKSQGKEDQSLRSRDWYEVVGEKQEVDSRDKVNHIEKNDQLLKGKRLKLSTPKSVQM